MKHWQARGEVEDSEDDELSLDETPSPEPPRKRQRQNHENAFGTSQYAETTEIESQNHPPEEADTEAWLRPKIVNTYGRRAAFQKQELSATDSTLPLARTRRSSSVDSAPFNRPLSSPDVPTRELSTSSRTNSPSIVAVPRDEGHGVSSTTESGSKSNFVVATGTPAIAKDTFEPTSDSEDELQAGPVFPRQRSDSQHNLVSSPLSSVPSEREISPFVEIPRVEPFTAISASTTPVPRTPATARQNAGMKYLADSTVVKDNHFPSTAVTKRNLRDRKPEQLNPYQIERMRYLAQCRARGVKPVKFVEQETSHEDTEDAPHSSQEHEQVGSGHVLSSSAPEDVRNGIVSPSDRANAAFYDETRSGDRSFKRNKLSKIVKPAHASRRTTNIDDLPAPPSPPRTSSSCSTSDALEESALPDSRRLASGFIMPLGLTPAPLPTPQISSEARRVAASPRTDFTASPRIPDQNPRRGSRSILLSSSEDESEADLRRLRREQKRIKGVLPASWLRLDLQARAHKRPSSPPKHSWTVPSPGTGPQKGVARPVKRSAAVSEGASDMPIWKGVDSDPEEHAYAHTPLREQVSPQQSSRPLVMGVGDMDDDENMENDFVDPMLAGSASRPARNRKRTGRQPRIKDALTKAAANRHEFSEERLNTYSKRIVGVPRSRTAESLQKPRQPGHHHVHLSIADFPASPNNDATHLPSFVRLALRRARHIKDLGRHSPGGKVIRLATKDDTEEASSVLRAWRNGSISPREGTKAQAPCLKHDEKYERHALAEMSNNYQQQTFASPLQKRKLVSAIRPSVRTSRMRQTRLQPIQQSNQIQDSGSGQDVTGSEKHQGTVRRRRESTQRLRGAQLETLEKDFDDRHREAMFERRMQCLTESVALPTRKGRASGVQLDRYLDGLNARLNDLVQHEHVGAIDQEHIDQPPSDCAKFPRRARKGVSTRIDIDTETFHQADTVSEQSVSNEGEVDLKESTIPGHVLRGLGSFGTKYTPDFEVLPLVSGTYFHRDTFIGSLDFDHALKLSRRDHGHPGGQFRLYLNDKTFHWSAWTDEVATQLSCVTKTIRGALQELVALQHSTHEQYQNVDRNVEYFLRSIVRYCSNCLYFLDPVDRLSCIQKLEGFVAELSDILTDSPPQDIALSNTVARIRQYQLVIAKQAQQLCCHPIITADLRSRVNDLVSSVARDLARHAIKNRLEELTHVYSSLQTITVKNSGIQDDTWALSSTVILNNVSRDHASSQSLFWKAINATLGLNISKTCAIDDIEQSWRSIFILLPALEIDSTGMSRVGSRLANTQENWDMVRCLVQRTLDLYDGTSRIRGFTVNDYVRTLFSRIHGLINRWGWWKCGSILSVVYDFFAKRNLGLLRHEEAHGSPKFLEDLGNDPTFDILPDDPSFHIFLKLLASAMVGMKKHGIHADSKITGIAWRLLPNHSRTCRKDADLQRSELEALRNHYDLLCTLYFAMPAGRRISVDIPRLLVDQATSHREACRLSVRAWANMTSFQVSTTEPVTSLEPLSAWYVEILKANLAQFRLARIEAEHAKHEAEADGIYVDNALLESTIVKNQTEIANTIVDALAGLKRAVASVSSLELARALIGQTHFWAVFELFDPGQHRLLSVALEALRVVDAVLDVEERLLLPSVQFGSSEDSQDFGDSTALQELIADEDVDMVTPLTTNDILALPISEFLSKVFGSDVPADEILLERLVDVRVRLAAAAVRAEKTKWSEYIDQYSTTSWHQMRDTPHKRKYALYFITRVVEQCSMDREVVPRAVTAWLISLVEREAMLKFQPILTSTLLNCCPDDPLLHNVPFAQDCRSGHYDISLHEIRQRRLALISSVLFNMRTHFEYTCIMQPRRRDEVHTTYRSMLRQLMQAMKTNYQELQGRGDVAEAGVDGAYVDFVQQIVSALQQHVSGICQVDRFFTDSTAFPLPATDPTYVVGRLRSYTPKLRESRSRTQLAVFVQAVSERAAIDGQQHYLSQQLVAAVNGTPKPDNPESSVLRHVLLASIMPTYIENALTQPCAWILALPMLEASEQIIRDLLYDIQIGDDESVIAASEMVSAVLDSIAQQWRMFSLSSNPLSLPHVLKIRRYSINVARSSLTLTSAMKRSTTPGADVATQLAHIYERLLTLKTYLAGENDDVDLVDNPTSTSLPWPDTKLQAGKLIRESLSANWSTLDGRYWVKRGNATKEVVVELQGVDEEKTALLEATAGFCDAFDATDQPRRRRLRRDDALGDLIV